MLTHPVVYQQHLIALFAPGYFACYRLPDFQRDVALEKQLNTEKFAWHQTLGEQLIGWRERRAFCFDTVRQAWRSYQPAAYFGGKLLEDERFICSSSCGGEFGGNLYFFDKLTHRTHYMPTTCATAVWQQAGHYRVLASLNHMSGSASSGIITDPTKLPLNSVELNPSQDWQYSFPGSVPDPNVKREFNFIGLTTPGALRWHDQTLYLVNWRQTVFLAAIADQQITIADSLFSADMPEDDVSTIAYAGGVTLVSLLNYNKTQEGSTCLLFQGQQVTKIEWGKPR